MKGSARSLEGFYSHLAMGVIAVRSTRGVGDSSECERENASARMRVRERENAKTRKRENAKTRVERARVARTQGQDS